MNTNYNVKNPILFLIFNRPDTTEKVFKKIKLAKPSKLYLAADGPRKNKENEAELCAKTREIVSVIDWKCEVKTLFRTENLGCKYAVSSAINWFFENENQGIILEDDCLPHQDFFRFCDEMLHYYKDDKRIRHIGGSNFQMGNKRGEASYYFSKLSHVWGWATWKRAWNDYDVELKNYKNNNAETLFKNVFNDFHLEKDWNLIFNQLIENKIDTWDYQWSITNFFSNGVSVIPTVNLISNIGFNENATHTTTSNAHANLEVFPLDAEITHPITFEINTAADYFTLSSEHNLVERKKISFYKRLKRFLFPNKYKNR